MERKERCRLFHRDQFGLKAMKSRLRCSLRPRRSELATPRTLIKT